MAEAVFMESLSPHTFLFLLKSDLLKAKKRRYVQSCEADHHSARKLGAAPPAGAVCSIESIVIES